MEILSFIAFSILPVIAAAIAIRVAYVFYCTGKPLRASTSKSLRTLIILGSGGHTAEMLSIINILQKDRFDPRYYVAAETDSMSLQKARVLEESLIHQGEIICNGPGTCIPLCGVAFLFKVAGFGWSSIFYVESIARVRKFSLSGLLLYKLHLADQIFVQWPNLQKKHPRAQYVGCLM